MSINLDSASWSLEWFPPMVEEWRGGFSRLPVWLDGKCYRNGNGDGNECKR